MNNFILITGKDNFNRTIGKFIYDKDDFYFEQPDLNDQKYLIDDRSVVLMNEFGILTDFKKQDQEKYLNFRKKKDDAFDTDDLFGTEVLNLSDVKIDQLKPGNLISARLIKAFPDDQAYQIQSHDKTNVQQENLDTIHTYPVMVKLGAVEVLASDQTAQQACTFVEEYYKNSPELYLFNEVTRVYELDYQVSEELALREDNQALVVVWNNKNDKYNSGPNGYLLAKRGIYFFHTDGNNANEAGMDLPEPGVWFFNNAKGWSTGDGIWEEYDSGVDGDFEHATSKHFDLFKIKTSEILTMLKDSLDGYLDMDENPIEFLISQGMPEPEWYTKDIKESFDQTAVISNFKN